MQKLSARKAATAGPGTYPDGGGLYLCVSPTLTRTWAYRFSWRGRRPEMGLGSLDQGVSLAEARTARDEARQILRSGRNPIEVRREARRLAVKVTFGEIADDLLKASASVALEMVEIKSSSDRPSGAMGVAVALSAGRSRSGRSPNRSSCTKPGMPSEPQRMGRQAIGRFDERQ
jgi:hypothetical protein